MNDIVKDGGSALEQAGRTRRRTAVAPASQPELPLAPSAGPLAQVPRAAVTPMDLLATAVQRGASVDEMAKLWDIAEKVRQQQAQQAYVEAMNRFKKNAPTIEKTRKAKVDSRKGEGASFAYKYANLADVCAPILKALSDVGISHSWASDQKNGQVTVCCTLTHELGHSASTKLEAPLDASGGKNTLQAIGSTVSYLERYTLLAVCGLAVDDEQDDDGAGATGAERDELRQLAGEMRQGKEAPAATPLLAKAQAAADKGLVAFGEWLREVPEPERRTLAPMLDALTKRAAAAKVK